MMSATLSVPSFVRAHVYGGRHVASLVLPRHEAVRLSARAEARRLAGGPSRIVMIEPVTLREAVEAGLMTTEAAEYFGG